MQTQPYINKCITEHNITYKTTIHTYMHTYIHTITHTIIHTYRQQYTHANIQTYNTARKHT